MTSLPPTPSIKLTIGTILKTLRTSVGLSGEKLGSLAHMSQSKISKIENGREAPTRGDVAALVSVLKPTRETIEEIEFCMDALVAPEHYYWKIEKIGLVWKQRQYQSIQSLAVAVRSFQISLIPGLLQTRAYAESVLRSFVRDIAAQVAHDAAVERVKRQEILKEGGRHFEFIVLERALSSCCWNDAIQVEQLAKLLSISELKNVRLAVLPDRAATPTPLLNGFTIFDDRFACAETMTAEVALEDRRNVRRYLRLFREIGEVASWGDDARLMIDGAMRSFSR